MTQSAPRPVDVEKVGELLSARIGELTHQVAVQSVMLEALAEENGQLRQRVEELSTPDVDGTTDAGEAPESREE